MYVRTFGQCFPPWNRSWFQGKNDKENCLLDRAVRHVCLDFTFHSIPPAGRNITRRSSEMTVDGQVNLGRRVTRFFWHGQFGCLLNSERAMGGLIAWHKHCSRKKQNQRACLQCFRFQSSAVNGSLADRCCVYVLFDQWNYSVGTRIIARISS